MTVPVGELAALMTSILWSVTSIQFTLAGRRIGSEVVNRVRLLVAFDLAFAVSFEVPRRI